jgi:hypothetical protein
VKGLLLYNGGTVCDDDFDENAATAICKEMGHTGANYWTSGADSFRIQHDLEIKMDEVHCMNDTWSSCDFDQFHDCSHREDVFLECSQGKPHV